MPGYESERFVALSEVEKTELTCSICQDILCDPMVAHCCLQTFCSDCITGWLKVNNTCPYDRKVLTADQLSHPPRALINMLGSLRIYCDYRDNGCNDVLILENLSQHTIKCQFNSKKCDKCLQDLQKRGHDCVKGLLELIENLKLNPSPSVPVDPGSCQSDGSFSADKSLIRENNELKLARDQLTKTIQELSNGNDIKEHELFILTRGQISTPTIYANRMNEEMTNKILAIIGAELMECNTLFTLCKNIVDKLNQLFGKLWHCVATYRNKGRSYYLALTGFSIQLSYGLLSLIIYKTSSHDIKSTVNRFRSGQIEREINILYTNFKQSMLTDVKLFVFSALESKDTLTEISKYMTNQMEKQFGGHWQCFSYICGSASLGSSQRQYLTMKLDDLYIFLFQINN